MFLGRQGTSDLNQSFKSRISCWDRPFKYRAIYSPCSFTHMFLTAALKHYCFEINECTLHSRFTSTSYLLLSLHKGVGLTSLFTELELYRR